MEACRNRSGISSGNLPEPSGTARKLEQPKQASGKSSGNLPEPSGTAGKCKCPNLYFRSLPASLPETFRNLPELRGNENPTCGTFILWDSTCEIIMQALPQILVRVFLTEIIYIYIYILAVWA